MCVVANGIAGIGHILGGIGSKEGREVDGGILNSQALSDIGWLLEELGESRGHSKYSRIEYSL